MRKKPNYIKAGFKTELAFLEWLCPKTRKENNIEEYRKWGYPSRGAVLAAYGDALAKANGRTPAKLEPYQEEDEQTAYVIPAGENICDN